MIARLRVAGQETWHNNVTRVTCQNGYLTLDLDAYPHRVHCWLGGNDVHVTVYATGEDVTAALRQEQAIKHSLCDSRTEYAEYLAGVHDPRD